TSTTLTLHNTLNISRKSHSEKYKLFYKSSLNCFTSDVAFLHPLWASRPLGAQRTRRLHEEHEDLCTSRILCLFARIIYFYFTQSPVRPSSGQAGTKEDGRKEEVSFHLRLDSSFASLREIKSKETLKLHYVY